MKTIVGGLLKSTAQLESMPPERIILGPKYKNPRN